MNLLEILPEFPRTRHLWYKPNAQRNDLICSEEECKIIFQNEQTFVEEKIDGASAGICWHEGHPVIRNRNNILQKGKAGHLRTPAKLQFASIYNWAYENAHKFNALRELSSFDYTIYGEWLYALHGIRYDKLPSYFIAYDLYDYEKKHFINTRKARDWLTLAGFHIPTLLHKGAIPNWEIFDKFCSEPSAYSSTDTREGVYVKVCNDYCITHRFKRVRPDFIQGGHWDQRKLTKNKLGG